MERKRLYSVLQVHKIKKLMVAATKEELDTFTNTIITILRRFSKPLITRALKRQAEREVKIEVRKEIELEVREELVEKARRDIQSEVEKARKIVSNAREIAKETDKGWRKGKDIAKIFSVQPSAINTWRLDGVIPYTMVGQTYLYSIKAIEDILVNNMIEVSADGAYITKDNRVLTFKQSTNTTGRAKRI